MTARRRIVIIGAGIAGCSLADELTARGETDVTVIDRGPLFATGGSTSHAPGLVSRTSPSRMLHQLADYTIEKLLSLELDGTPCFLPVGVLELATTEERLFELQRRRAFASAWGFHGRLVDPEECGRLHPLVAASTVLGGFHTEGEGIAKALRGAEAQARRAQTRGARFLGDTRVLEVVQSDGIVTGVRTANEVIAADIVVCCAGAWGRAIAATAGVVLPAVAMEHQYAITEPLPALARYRGGDAGLPFVRHWDGGVYIRDEGDRAGIGSFNHRALPVSDGELEHDNARRLEPAMMAFTPEDWEPGWEATVEVMPDLRGVELQRAFNGVFPYSPDGFPLIGEAATVSGFWVLECVWVTHAVGAARSLAEILRGDAPTVDLTPADLARFDHADLARAVYEERCANAYVDTYAIHHPGEPSTGPRGVRRSPFWTRQEALGAAFFDSAGWERPRWYEANRDETGALPPRDAWSSRHWSPIAGDEHRLTRERAGLFDLTPVPRILVTGPDSAALFPAVDVGTVTRKVFVDDARRVVAYMTIARLGDERFLVGGNSPRDALWLRALAGTADVRVEDITAGTCCLAVWGPSARALLDPIADLPHRSVAEIEVGGVPVIAVRDSCIGEPGWELTTGADTGLRLWDAVWAAGQDVGAVAVGTAAFTSLRLEKGHRVWGQDVTRNDTPEEAGLEHGGEPRQRLRTLRLGPGVIPTGGEPVMTANGALPGHVTSAEYGWTVGFPIALAWVPADVAVGETVTVVSPAGRIDALVVDDVPFDPEGERLG